MVFIETSDSLVSVKVNNPRGLKSKGDSNSAPKERATCSSVVMRGFDGTTLFWSKLRWLHELLSLEEMLLAGDLLPRSSAEMQHGEEVVLNLCKQCSCTLFLSFPFSECVVEVRNCYTNGLLRVFR